MGVVTRSPQARLRERRQCPQIGKQSDAHLPPSPPQEQQPLAVSRGLQAKTRASPTLRKLLVLTLFGVAARIGASIVARLANIPDISCIERLAITNSGPQRTRVSLC